MRYYAYWISENRTGFVWYYNGMREWYFETLPSIKTCIENPVKNEDFLILGKC